MSSMPSNDFFLRQACLNINPADTWKIWWRFVGQGGDVDFMGYLLQDIIRKEFRRLRASWPTYIPNSGASTTACDDQFVPEPTNA